MKEHWRGRGYSGGKVSGFDFTISRKRICESTSTNA